MNYGKKSPSMGTPSVYSHVTTRSSANLRSSRSVRSVKIPWYQKRLLTNAFVLDIQRGAMVTGIYSLFLSLFTICTAVFDIYCLSQAAPGSIHYGYYLISYEFVYVGNEHVRNALIVFALFSMLGGMVILVTSFILIKALRKEYEKKMVPWLYSFAIFTLFRLFAFLFFSIVNDMIFAYNIMMCLLWITFSAASIYGWLVVYSLYIELSDLTRLEDLAHLRIGTMQSLNASTTHSIAGSRPTTPHSTVSTMPVN
ncbi:PREDICTED: uncharacterized protein LOC105363581 [Ceratosolen solmsi marchali]|uniref:Uncharacterized protein LOC105363581 n=1 Tax=Ceratosolen solmsi marchali TaxID=326594 RepID=A0AAJ7DX42_9HYME|nr:PREDICTED: uncharacterized protein LOC105363581 [Ceratosolen solmsi marchali]